MEAYEHTIFTFDAFAPAGLRAPVEVIPPAIDPLASKNVELPAGLARAAVAGFGPDPARPLLVQVARFDPWKDPMGVIAVRAEVPDAQLALVGVMATDDPQGLRERPGTDLPATADRRHPDAAPCPRG